MPQKASPESIHISVTTDGEDKLFTNQDVVAGQVELNCLRSRDDLHVRVTFEGSSFTCITNNDGLHTHLGRVIAKHLFLNASIDIADHHSDIRPSQTQALPFRFHIPGQAPHSCRHSINDVELQARHTIIRPSMVLSKRVFLEDGVTVDAAKIAYGIRVVVRSRGGEIGRIFKVLKIVSSGLVLPSPQQVMLCGQTMLKSSQAASRGNSKLVVESEVLPVLRSPDPTQERRPVLGKLDLLLRYDSTENDATPIEISKIDIKIKAITYYNARPFRNQPSIPDSVAKGYRYLEETLETSAFAFGKIDWDRREPDAPRLQGQTRMLLSSAMLSPLSSVPTTTISIPITIAAMNVYTKFLPTFNTCLISRSYFAELEFTISHTKAPTPPFRVPILITSPSSNGPPPRDIFAMPDHELARLVSPPEYSEHLLDDLPAYEPADIRLVQDDGRVETFAYVKSEPWLNIHNGFKHGYKKLKGHLDVRQARAKREK